MNRKQVIETLKMENDLICFNPLTGEEIPLEYVNDLNKNCYNAHQEAIRLINNSIPIEWIKSKKIEYEHDRYDYCKGCFDGFNDCIEYLISEWEEESCQ